MPRTLQTCTHVYIRNDPIKANLTPIYDGPFLVLSIDDKTFKVLKRNMSHAVAINNVKPAFMLRPDSDHSSLFSDSHAYHQRWSRGHKARGQGQGHQKNPRPRTAFPRTDPVEAKDRNARGQGQGPRTQPQVFSKKKGLQKSFLGNLQFIGVARSFDWGSLNHKSHAMTSSKICLLALNHDFAKGEGLN